MRLQRQALRIFIILPCADNTIPIYQAGKTFHRSHRDTRWPIPAPSARIKTPKATVPGQRSANLLECLCGSLARYRERARENASTSRPKLTRVNARRSKARLLLSFFSYIVEISCERTGAYWRFDLLARKTIEIIFNWQENFPRGWRRSVSSAVN